LAILFGVVLAASAFLQAAPSGAHLRLHFDANDAKFDDLSSVRLHTYRNPDGVKMLLANAEFFPEPSSGECCWEVRFVMDSRGDGQADYVLHVAYDDASGGVFYAFLERPDGSVVDARVRMTRDCGGCYSHLPAKIKFGAIHPARHVRWYVSTSYDRAPDAGWYTH
jgi:hypothetical protein